MVDPNLWISQRPYSIRTRIKTNSRALVSYNCSVRDHIPLEQGLRQAGKIPESTFTPVRDHIPLEQGLRHYSKSII